jgi:hypothetical protein
MNDGPRWSALLDGIAFFLIVYTLCLVFGHEPTNWQCFFIGGGGGWLAPRLTDRGAP